MGLIETNVEVTDIAKFLEKTSNKALLKIDNCELQSDLQRIISEKKLKPVRGQITMEAKDFLILKQHKFSLHMWKKIRVMFKTLIDSEKLKPCSLLIDSQNKLAVNTIEITNLIVSSTNLQLNKDRMQ